MPFAVYKHGKGNIDEVILLNQSSPSNRALFCNCQEEVVAGVEALLSRNSGTEQSEPTVLIRLREDENTPPKRKKS